MRHGETSGFPLNHSAAVNSGSMWAHLALLAVAAMALTFPCLTRGLPEGHDRVAQISYQHFFNQQIAAGELYPRWMPGLNGGLGGGIFFMQYPLPYYVAWGIGRIIPNDWGVYTETRTLGLGMVLATILAALFTYAWCANFADRLSAMLAALVYISLPYFLSIDLYMRISIGEFWALSLLPLSFLFVERMFRAPRQSLAGLGAAFSLVLLSHLFTAVLLAPVLLAYAVWRSERARRISAMIQATAGLALAAGVAGVYMLPAVVNRRFLHPENFIPAYGGNYSPLSQMFLFNSSMFPKAGRGWLGMGEIAQWMGVATLAVIVFAFFLSRKREPGLFRPCLAIVSCATLSLTVLSGYFQIGGDVPGALPIPHYLVEQKAEIFLCSFLTLQAALLCYWILRDIRYKGLANFLVLLALASYLMMTSASQFVWKMLHFLWTIQFPWRLNVFLVVATAGLAALAISELRKASPRSRLFGIAAVVIVWGLVAGGTAKVGTMEPAFVFTRPLRYEPSLDVALPIYAQMSPQVAVLVKLPDDDTLHAVITAGSGRAAASFARPRLIELSAQCDADCTLQLSQFYYPTWRAKLLPGNTDVPLRAASPGGLMEVSLPAGQNNVELELPRGWSERIGPWLSLLCLSLVAVLAITGGRAPAQPAVIIPRSVEAEA